MTARKPVSDEPLISMADVASRLGVPLKTFRHWRAHNRAPLGYPLGGRVQFRWSEVEAWLQERREQDTRPALRTVTGRRAG
jgi:predicted DNA-binding transcriptional regulator AlpA